MILDLQKANVVKRISAFLFDIILLSCVAIGIVFGLSAISGIDKYQNEFEDYRKQYEEEYGISIDITAEEFDKLSEEDKKIYDDASKAFTTDPEVNKVYSVIASIIVMVSSIGILLSFVIMEFIIPLIIGNGQTLGKKIFGIALMRVDGVKVTTLQMFVRSILGKYTVETMIPLLMIAMIFQRIIGIVGIIVILGLLLLEVIIFFASKNRSMIHDLFAATVAVDFASQMIFTSVEEMVEYKKEIAAKDAAQKPY